jgi:hypothetical protein
MRNHIVVVIAIALAVEATRFALAQAQPPAADGASERAVVRELRELNRRMERLNRSIGRRDRPGASAVGLLQEICEMTRSEVVGRVPSSLSRAR